MRESRAVKHTVVLADRQALCRRGLRMLLESEGLQVVVDTSSGQDAVEQADRRQPDLLVLDLDLEVLPGLEVIRQVRRSSPATRILVLTQVEACASVIGAVRAGAQGYCLRSSSPEEFLRALDAVVHGDMFVAPRVARHLVACHCSDEDLRDGQCVQCLTGREVQIVKLVAEGFSSPQIGTMLNLSPATVDRHRANLMQKLGLHSVPALVLFAVRTGLVDPRKVPA